MVGFERILTFRVNKTKLIAMNRFRLILIAVFTIAFINACTETTKPIDTPLADVFTSQDGSYQILFPGEPEHNDEYIPFETGDMTISMDIYSPNESIIYAVKFNEYPAEVFEEIDETFNRELIQNALSSTKSQYGLDTHFFEEERFVNGFLGYYYQGHNDQYYVTCLYTLVKNKLYQVVLSTEVAFLDQKEIDQFFNSFQIVKS